MVVLRIVFIWALAGLAGWLLGSTANALPLSTVGTFCSTFPSQCQKGTEALLAARGIGTDVYYVLEVDPTTGALPVDVTGGSITVDIPSVGPTGSAVPADADYQGLNNGGTLIGAVGDSSGRTIVAGAGTAGVSTGGVLSVQGVASGTAIPVSGTVTANQGGAPWSMTGTGAAGTAASGVLTVQGIAAMTPLLVNGSGSIQPVSGTVTANQGGTWTVQPGNTANTTAWLVDQATAAATFQDGAIAFGALTTSYATVVTTGGVVRVVQIRNNTNAVVVVSLDAGSTTSYTLDAGDYVSVDLKSNGRSIASSTALQAKYSGAAPTSGSIRVNVVY